METQLGKVECELKQSLISQDGLKKRMNELQEHLNQMTGYQEKELQEVRQQLRDAYATTRDANQNVQRLEDSRAIHQEKANKVQMKLDMYKQEAEDKMQQMQRDKTEIEEKFETLRSSCSVITDLEEQLTETSERCQELMLQNAEIEKEIEGLWEEKNGLEVGQEEMEEELGEKRRTCGNQELVSYKIMQNKTQST